MVSQPISGLQPGTTYHFQFCARDDLESPPRTNCSPDQTFATGSAGGRSGLVYEGGDPLDDDLWVADANGANAHVLTDTTSASSESDPSYSPTGKRVAYQFFGAGPVQEIFSIDSDGVGPAVNLTQTSTAELTPAWSPDGSKIAYSAFVNNNFDVWVMNADGSGQVRLTTDAAEDSNPAWSPDGSRIAFSSSRDGNSNVYVMNADGSGQRRLTTNTSIDGSAAWSPDGTIIAFTSLRFQNNGNIFLMDAERGEAGSVVRLTSSTDSESEPTWSPDGAKIVYRHITLQDELWVMSAFGTGQTQLDSVRRAAGVLPAPLT